MDYREVVRALRAKAASTEYAPEREALLAKAKELERRFAQPKTVEKVTITFVHPATKEWVTKTFEFPDDWYETMDEWDNYDSGSGAE